MAKQKPKKTIIETEFVEIWDLFKGDVFLNHGKIYIVMDYIIKTFSGRRGLLLFSYAGEETRLYFDAYLGKSLLERIIIQEDEK